MSLSQITRQWRPYLPTALMLIGIVLVGYVSHEYYGMYSEQKRLTQEWMHQNIALPPSAAPVIHERLTRLEIPKISLDAIVVDGTTHKQLKVGPGRVGSTVLPGENGNSVITAHRDTFFRHIYELVKGDEILVRRDGDVYRFAVTGKRVVEPDDLSVLDPTSDAQLTLITCYPTYYIGPAPERLIVTSRLIDKQVASATR